jgi:hypothetical protein
MCGVQLSPENAEEYIDYLRSIGRLDEAAVRLAAIVNDENFVSKEGKSNYQVGVDSLYPHIAIVLLRELFLILSFSGFLP